MVDTYEKLMLEAIQLNNELLVRLIIVSDLHGSLSNNSGVALIREYHDRINDINKRSKDINW